MKHEPNAVAVRLSHFESCLSQLIAEQDIPSKTLKKAIEYVLFSGGKRVRPMLVYLTGDILNIPEKALDTMAMAIELIHTYSLVHDDLPAMDDDHMRRGQPSCHIQFDEATAILVGDALQALAAELLLTQLHAILSPQQIIEVTKALFHAAGPSGLVSGQCLDLTTLNGTNASNISESALIEIHDLKTARLMLACVNMTLAASEATDAIARALRLFAAHLGFVFQMQDDYLDAYGPPDALGKGRNSDAANQKSTFAHCYSEKALQKTIETHFQTTEKALSQLGDAAEPLRWFLKHILARSNLTPSTPSSKLSVV